jgi:DHA1 family tetracycline resistance protein-like MFS transporter
MSKTDSSPRMFPILLAIFIDMVGVGIIIPVIAPLIINNHTGLLPMDWSLEERNILYGILLAVYPLAQFFGSPMLGALSDRHGRKPILSLALLGSMVGYLMFAWGIVSNSLELILAGRIIDGFTGGNISIVFSAVADLSNSENKARNFGLIGMMAGLGWVIGPFLGGLLANEELVSWFGPSVPFWMAAGLCLFNVIVILFQFQETLRQKDSGSINLLTGFKNFYTAFSLPNLRTMFTVIFLATLGFAFFTQFFSVLMVEKFSFEEMDLGIFFGVVGVCIAITQGLILRPVTRRFASHQIPKVTLLGLALVLTAIIFQDTVTGLYLMIPFVALTQGLGNPNLQALISELATESQQGKIMGIKESIASIGIAVPSLIAGFLSGIDYHLPLIAASLFTFAAWAVFTFVFKSSRKIH